MSTTQKLQDNDPMPFGQHQGKAMVNVPAKYLLYIYNKGWCSAWPAVSAYIQDNMEVLRKEEGGRGKIMTTLSIDIETFSSVDLGKCGVYKYVESSDFEILLFAFSIDYGPVEIVDLASGEFIPETILDMIFNERVKKTAWNAAFERLCLQEHFKRILPWNEFYCDYAYGHRDEINLPISEWECTMIKAGFLGLPLKLEECAKVLKLNVQKDAAGKALIKLFSIPRKPTAKNKSLRNTPTDLPEKWAAFKNYCIVDVQVENEIGRKVSAFPISDFEKKLYILDQRINDRGVMLDPEFIGQAIKLDRVTKESMLSEAVQLTGLDNPNSASQLKQWLEDETGSDIADMRKESLPAILKNTDSAAAKRVIELRQQMSKTSLKKYPSMLNVIGTDNRVRGLFQFIGANRTHRWGGRLIQPQNLPKNSLEDLDLARQLVSEGNLEDLSFLFGNVPDTLSQLIRTAFVAPPGKKLIVSDFSAIEARVIAWMAGEKWRLDVFNTHGKIYEASASQMFKIPIEKVDKALRGKGKIAELALGFQGSVGALEKMGALKMGLEKHELKPLVEAWRSANPKIVKLWYAVQRAAIEAVTEPGLLVTVDRSIKLSYQVQKGILFCNLPSGGRLAYIRPQIYEGPFGPTLRYEGMNQTTKKWEFINTYGGSLVENAVQATARDILAEALIRLDEAGESTVMHVHDETVNETDIADSEALERINSIMGRPVSWGPGLPLGAEGYECLYYKKD